MVSYVSHENTGFFMLFGIVIIVIALAFLGQFIYDRKHKKKRVEATNDETNLGPVVGALAITSFLTRK